MPPMRGRGAKGLSRGRPPPAVRSAMAEIGKGSLATYELLAQAAARSNVDAARGYFPELENGKKAEPKKLVDSEIHIVKLSEEMHTDMVRSPHYVQTRDRTQITGWRKDLRSLEQYYLSNSTASRAKLTLPSTEEKSKPHSSSPKGKDYSTATMTTTTSSSSSSSTALPTHIDENLWQMSKCWYIAELLPAELIPKKMRNVKSESGILDSTSRPAKRSKQGPVGPGGATENGSLVSRLKQEANKLGGGDEDGEDGEGEGDEGDGADNEVGLGAAADDEDDLELDADYQTGIKFDDDEGYEEQDSGAEEATF